MLPFLTNPVTVVTVERTRETEWTGYFIQRMNEKLNLEQIVEDKVPIEKECIVSLDIRAQ